MVIDSTLNYKQKELLCDRVHGLGANGIVECIHLEKSDYHIIKYFDKYGIEQDVQDIHFEMSAKFLRSNTLDQDAEKNKFLLRGNMGIKQVEFKHNGELTIKDF